MAPSSKYREFLYVSYLFPPLLGGGVVRAERACELLPELLWRPTLLTCAVDNAEATDRRYLERGVEVIRPRAMIKENLVRAKPRGSGKTKASLATQVLRSLAQWFLVPDRQVLWKYPAQRLAIQTAGKHDWQCVLGTLHPISSAWVGQYVALRLGLPFVLEFRDIISEKFEGGPPTPLHRWILRYIVRKLVRNSARIVVVSNAMKNWVVEKYDTDPNHVVVVTSGFLPANKELFSSLPTGRNERFTMVYAGAFQRQRKPDTILEAVRSLVDAKVIERDKVRVVFIGNLLPSAVSQFDLDGVAETVPMIPRQEVFQWYSRADLLLLICDKCDYQNATIPGKLFEYMMTEKPILGLLDKKNDVAGILRQSGLGVVADADDVEEVAAQIKHFYKLWSTNNLTVQPNRKFIEQFNFRDIMQEMVAVLEGVVGN